MENPSDLVALSQPKLALNQREGLIIIDEIQLMPNLFPLLRYLIDTPSKKQQWLILGSDSRGLIQQSSESLAGRIAYLEVQPFDLSEASDRDELWLRGGFPNAYLAPSTEASAEWRKQYIKTFLEQDIPNLGIQIPATNLRRFWMMLAHYHGNILNLEDLSRSLGINSKTIRYYLDVLTGTFMIRKLQPWCENIGKRQVKTPKIYFRDSGLLHELLGIETSDILYSHPKIGASWEGFALEELIRCQHFQQENCYFWSTHQQAELDFLVFHKSKRLGFEFKYADAPKLSKSMHIVCKDLKLDLLTVIYPGSSSYQLSENIWVRPLSELVNPCF